MSRTSGCVLGLAFGAVLGVADAGVLITDLSGRATIEGKRPVAVLSEVAVGERIELAAGSRLVGVDLVTGREYVLVGADQFLVEKGGVRGLAGGSVESRPLPVSHLPEARISVARVAQATLTMRGTGLGAAPNPLSPARTAIQTVTPELRWTAVEGATDYRVRITDDGGRTILDVTTKLSSLALTQGAGLTQGRTYSWRVEARNVMGHVNDASTSFSIVSADTARRLAQLVPAADASYSRRVLYAVQLQEAGVNEDAQTLWRLLAAERPDDPNLAKLAR